MDWEPAVLEAAQPWEPRFVPRGTVPETATSLLSLLSRKPTRLNPNAGQQQQNPRGLLHGVPQDATFGKIKAAATIQSAERREGNKKRVGGSTTSQVS